MPAWMKSASDALRILALATLTRIPKVPVKRIFLVLAKFLAGGRSKAKTQLQVWALSTDNMAFH